MVHSDTRAAPAGLLLDPGLRGPVRVLGGPGTGKTRLLLDAAAARIESGADPESVLLLTGSGRLGARARGALTAALLAGPGRPAVHQAVRQPLVRSVHAYAFAVLRLAAQRAGDPPPRLITGAEQDNVVRELLAGDVEDGARGWPAALRGALSTDGFANELRDLMSRCAERGIDPVSLQRLGRRSGRPEWVAAGRFAQQYEQVMLLRSAVGMAAPQATVPALGAADLVGAALDALAADRGLLAAEHARIGLLLVDDVQNLDPQAALLVRVLADGVAAAVLAGDPNQRVFGFRGADAGALLDGDAPTVQLTTSHRCAPAIARAISGVAALLPGTTPARVITGSDDAGDGEVRAVLAASEHAEAAVVADALRRAHLIDGVPWSQLAVIVRSVARAGAGLPRALAAAGVPVAPPAMEAPLPDNAVVRSLLGVLAATAEGLDARRAEDLLTGPIGRVDPVTMRALRRALRRTGPDRDFGELLVDALRRGALEALAPAHRKPLRRVGAVLRAARRAAADPRLALWEAWRRSGLQQRLLAGSESNARGGTAGLRAAQNLDAVTALFDVAEQFCTANPGAGVAALLDHVAGLRLPVRAAEPVHTVEAVSLVSPHQALGRDWDTVIIAGLQEGLWPNAVPRGGVLNTARLLDVIDDIPDDVSARAPVLADERRLLIAAMGRARRRLLVTAVDTADAGGDGGDLALPSPFFYDIAAHVTGADAVPRVPEPVAAPRVLSAPAVVGRLRAVVCAPEGGVADDERASAAMQLARLAAAGVRGADPADWYSTTAVSTADPLWSGLDHTVAVSPSSLQNLQDCPLRWLLERHGGRTPGDERATAGSLIHALIAQRGATFEQLAAQLDAVWPQLPFGAEWFSRNELDRHRAMLATFLTWREDIRRTLTEAGAEVAVDGVLPADGAAGPAVRVTGRIDRLERDAEGRLVVVDVKTGKSPVTKDDAQRHAQLGLYQLAISHGLAGAEAAPGGGRLVYLGKPSAGGATEREQDALTGESAAERLDQVRRAAAATAGPDFTARVNDGCTHCPVRRSCPAQHPSTEPS